MQIEVSDEEIELSSEFEQDLADLILSSQDALGFLQETVSVLLEGDELQQVIDNLKYALEPFKVEMMESDKEKMN